MKKQKILWLLIIIFLFALLLVICGVTNLAGRNPIETPSPTEPPVTDPPPTDPPATDPTDPPPEEKKLVENPFGKDDFIKNGHFISCKTEKTAIGVDVSRYQGNIDWKKLKAAGVDYVIIRAAFRGTAMSGNLVKDANVEKNYTGAKAAGLKVGFYLFSQANSVEEAEEEARFLLDIVKDWEVDLPLACDWEYFSETETPRVHGMTTRQITDCVKAFCEIIKEEGYYPMAHLRNNNTVFVEELASYGLWYADYIDYLPTPYRVDMWQYTEKGRVPGISGNVDLNLLFLENSIFAEIFKVD